MNSPSISTLISFAFFGMTLGCSTIQGMSVFGESGNDEAFPSLSEASSAEPSARPGQPEADLIDSAFFAAVDRSDVLVSDSTADANLSNEAAASFETGFVDTSWIWTPASKGASIIDGKLDISVCWINSSESNREGRELTQRAIEETWHSRGHVIFSGWFECSDELGGIRIKIADENPRAWLGAYGAQNETSMWLNFEFKKWSLSCSKDLGSRNWEDCVYSIAVHEFGHALSFIHEHNRLFDKPGQAGLSDRQIQAFTERCAKRGYSDGTGKVPKKGIFTAYDPDSCMNYCKDIYSQKTKPSPADYAAYEEAYRPPFR